MPETRTSNVIKNSVVGVVARAVAVLAQFFLRTVFIRVLGKEYAGISGLFADILGVLSVMELGLDSSMMRELTLSVAEGDDAHTSALLSFYRRAFTVIGVMFFLSGCIFSPFVEKTVSGVPDIPERIPFIFLAYAASSAVTYFGAYRAVFIKAMQKNRLVYAVGTAAQIAECVLSVVFICVLKHFYAYLAIKFICAVGRSIAIAFVAGHIYPIRFNANGKLMRSEKRTLMRDIFFLTAYDLSGVAVNSTDSIFISAFVGTVQVAVTGNFMLIINSVKSFIVQIVNATKSSVFDLAATSSADKQVQVFRRMDMLVFYMACVCSACMFTLLNMFVGDIWFDASYKMPLPVVGLLVFNFYLAVTVLPVESFRAANGLFKRGWQRPLCTAVLNLALDVLLGRIYGVAGIFAATAVARIATQIWFDPFLLYKFVFPGKLKMYYAEYLLRSFFTFFVCAVAYVLSDVTLGCVYATFAVRCIISFSVSNIMLVVFLCRNSDFVLLRKTVENKFRAKLRKM